MCVNWYFFAHIWLDFSCVWNLVLYTFRGEAIRLLHVWHEVLPALPFGKTHPHSYRYDQFFTVKVFPFKEKQKSNLVIIPSSHFTLIVPLSNHLLLLKRNFRLCWKTVHWRSDSVSYLDFWHCNGTFACMLLAIAFFFFKKGHITLQGILRAVPQRIN